MPVPKEDVIVEPICLFCFNATLYEWGYCDAFPKGLTDGIPQEILKGTAGHTKVRKDQFGSFIFDPI
jgi:hypothetical protein